MLNESQGDFQERLMCEAGLINHVKYEEIVNLARELGHGKFTTQNAREQKFKNALSRLKEIMGLITKSIPCTRQVKITDHTAEYTEDFWEKYPDMRISIDITYVDADYNQVRVFKRHAITCEMAMKLIEEKFSEQQTFIA